MVCRSFSVKYAESITSSMSFCLWLKADVFVHITQLVQREPLVVLSWDTEIIKKKPLNLKSQIMKGWNRKLKQNRCKGKIFLYNSYALLKRMTSITVTNEENYYLLLYSWEEWHPLVMFQCLVIANLFPWSSRGCYADTIEEMLRF